ncbi:hypothetical protein K435DRAFT_821992 [Dendrothele bispora CBS 962.96]|uniref:NFACT RNA-binding domain-containing protein n=1 Tax=Dendrothele bispora (strain CBS 962.96) TaxID=1314807 RepID=A0A4V6T562_DENBC|nr:hypothetical protein K435DRAFT_821992 [Dendrothele bispora CBS 962.96]
MQATNSPAVVYMGYEELIKYAWSQDLSSAHVYLRMPDEMTWDAIPESLLTDLAQLVKANSIEGNKKDNLTIIYTPAANLIHIAKRENAIVNRLNKTKVEKEVDHEQERVDRLKKESTAHLEVAHQREAEKAA